MSDFRHLERAAQWWHYKFLCANKGLYSDFETSILEALKAEWNNRFWGTGDWEIDVPPIILTSGHSGLGFFLTSAFAPRTPPPPPANIQMSVSYDLVRAWVGGQEEIVWQRPNEGREKEETKREKING